MRKLWLKIRRFFSFRERDMYAMRKNGWYQIDGKFVHFDGWHIDGRPIGIKEQYEFMLKNDDILFE